MGDTEEKLLDRREIVGYRCYRCERNINDSYTHEHHMNECYAGCVEGIDYVECKLCRFVGRNIKQHVKRLHNFEEYTSTFNHSLIAKNTVRSYSNANVHNGDWISRAKDRGDDLAEYRKKMGSAVSMTIMNDPEERKRRSELANKILVDYAKSDRGRKNSSEAGKRTSSRLDILAKRTKRLHESRKPSKGELALGEFLVPLGFKRAHVIIDKDAFDTKTGRRVVDFINFDSKTIVEFDGAQHFKPYFPDQNIESTKKSDEQLNEWAFDHGYRMIRVSYDQYSYKKQAFKCDDELTTALESSERLILIGDRYGDTRT